MSPTEESTLTLTDAYGNEETFEYLDVIQYSGEEYLVLLDESEQIVILQIKPVDEENEQYVSVMEPAILDAVYNLFKEKYRDILTFEDADA